MNTTSTIACPNGAICTKVSIILPESMPVMKMEMDFMKYMSTHWKDFGLCFVPGYGLIEAFRKRNYPGIWDSSNLSTMFTDAGRLYSTPCSRFS